MNWKKIIKIVFISIILLSFLFTIIISQNTGHLEICHDDDCGLCNLINFVINIVSITFKIDVLTFSVYLITYILAKIRSFIYIIVKNTLLLQRVMFNE